MHDRRYKRKQNIPSNIFVCDSFNPTFVQYANHINMDTKKQKLPSDQRQKQAKGALQAWKKRNNQSTSLTSLNEQTFLNEQLTNELCEVLEHCHRNHSLDKTQQDTLRNHTQYLLKFSKNNNQAKTWFNQQQKLIDISNKCVEDIASYDYALDIQGTEDPTLESFDNLIESLSNIDCDQLVDVVLRCICNGSCQKVFENLIKSNTSTLNSTQHFLLITCPNYILRCDKDESHLQKLVEYLRHDYAQLVPHFLSNIEKWSDALVLCFLYLIRLILSDSDSLSFEKKCDIEEAVVRILLKEPLSVSNNDQTRLNVLHGALEILLQLIRSDDQLLDKLKKYNTDNDQLFEILKKISDDSCDERAQLHAFELLSFVMSEEEFDQVNDSAKVTQLIVKNINQALEDNKDLVVEDLIQVLKGQERLLR